MATLRCYGTVDDLRARMFPAGDTDTSDNARLLQKLRAATANIEHYTQREFMPWIATRQFDWKSAKLTTFEGYDLVQLTSIVDEGGVGNTVLPAATILLGGKTSNAADTNGPYYGAEIDIAKGSFLTYITERRKAIWVTGVWGWHDDYANAWKPSVDSPTSNVLIGDTTITVNNATGADGWGQSPRFSPGNLIQIDNEWMQVIGVSGNALSVVRGQQGTAAAAHNSATPISVYVLPADINDICLDWTSWLWSVDYADLGHIQTTAWGASMKAPTGTPAELLERLDAYELDWVS